MQPSMKACMNQIRSRTITPVSVRKLQGISVWFEALTEITARRCPACKLCGPIAAGCWAAGDGIIHREGASICADDSSHQSISRPAGGQVMERGNFGPLRLHCGWELVGDEYELHFHSTRAPLPPPFRAAGASWSRNDGAGVFEHRACTTKLVFLLVFFPFFLPLRSSVLLA